MIKKGDYNLLTARFYDIAYRKRLPLRVIFELTYRCNFKCVHCYVSDRSPCAVSKKELRKEEVFKILADLKKMGVLFIGFTGGEIFLRRDIFDILWHAKHLGFQIILLTNASLIDARIADQLKALSPNKVDITVHAMDRTLFDRITGVRGSAGKVFAAIELLRKRKVPLGLKSCGMQENKDEIVKINKFSRRLKVAYRLDNELTPRLDGSTEPLTHLLSVEEDYFLRKACFPAMFRGGSAAERTKKSPPVKIQDAKRVFNCGSGYTHFAISPYGQLKTCIEIDYPGYDLLKGTLRQGWNKIKKFVDGLVPPRNWICRSCDLAAYCSWCPAKAYLADGSFFNCDPYSRAQAEFAKEGYEKGS